MMAEYTIAKYLRISSDDGTHGDSQSISGQRDLINKFISEHPELKNVKSIEYCDDGFSGTNFERPAMKQLLDEIKIRKINCIVVKDFSRFGRSYIDVGDYIEQIFPFLRVRFISINDGYDSAAHGYIAGDVNTAFKNLYNDYYSKDLSRKIKSGLKTKWESGKYLSSQAIYGYKKGTEDKRRLEIDDEPAAVVRRIFSMAVSQQTPPQIAGALNLDGIKTPMMYLYQKKNVCPTHNLAKLWTHAKIIDIIRDIRYTGTVTGGMYAVDAIGSRRHHKKPKSQWHVSENKHEAIVSRDEYEKAQLSIRKVTSSSKQRTASLNSLSVKIRCGSCGHTMQSNHAKNPAYHCGYKNMIAGDSCFMGKMEASVLKEVLMASIQQLYEMVSEQKNTVSMETEGNQSRMLSSLKKEADNLESQKLTYYNRYNDGEISRDEYLSRRKTTNEQIKELYSRIRLLEEQNRHSKNGLADDNPICEIIGNIADPLRYSNELITALVDHVVVYNDNRIEIKWKFPDITINPFVSTK